MASSRRGNSGSAVSMKRLSRYGFESSWQQRQRRASVEPVSTVQAHSAGIIVARSILDNDSWLLGRLRIAGFEAIIQSRGWLSLLARLPAPVLRIQVAPVRHPRPRERMAVSEISYVITPVDSGPKYDNGAPKFGRLDCEESMA